jgi:hypothetical protein
MALLFAVLVAILAFLCLSGPDGMIGPKHRHCVTSPTVDFLLCTILSQPYLRSKTDALKEKQHVEDQL